jgi:menaquinone-dependent protoporphyrinogen IX oxidase
MVPEPTDEQLASEHAEELSRFESEGGSSAPIVEQQRDPRPRGLQQKGSDHRGRILIVCASQEPHVSRISNALAVRIRSHGFAVELGDASTGTMPPPQDYDVVILGVPMMFGRESQLIATYIDQNRAALADVPSALFTVSKSGTIRDRDPGGFLAQFLATVAWQPDVAAAFAGGAPFPRDGLLLRLATSIGHHARSHEGPTFRTNWTDVEQFADTVATELAGAALTAERTEPHVFGH